MNGYEALATTRINGVMQTLRDIRELPQQLTALNRTPLVNATDGEIMARYDRNVIVADVIADDQEATVVQGGKFTLEATHIPNIKKGSLVTQAMLNLLDRINAGGGVPNDQGILRDYVRRQVDERLLGIRQRMNQMIYGMWLDSFSYDHLGVKISAVSWGMPSDLKVTPSNLWSDATNATPVTDIRTLRRLAAEKYGENYNRITLSTTAWNQMTATAEFRNQAALILNTQTSLTSSNFAPILQNTTMLRQLTARVLDEMVVEIDDSQFWSEANAGTTSATKFLPVNKVILGSTADDNNASAMDFANGIVAESVASSLPGVNLLGGGFGGPQYGPVAYTTVKSDLNPPQATIWGVARGFPRKKRLSATAVLTVA